MQRSMQWLRDLTCGSCPSGAIAEIAKRVLPRRRRGEPARRPCAAAKKRFGRSCGWLTLARPQALPRLPAWQPIPNRCVCRSCPDGAQALAIAGLPAALQSAALRSAGSLTWGRRSLRTFFGGGKESECAAGRTSQPLRQCQTTKPGYRAQRQSAGRKDLCRRPDRKATATITPPTARRPPRKPHHMPTPKAPRQHQKK